ncbi:hypothetical protein K458DRAFT_414218 [Lentithecium fluviatile CBS 122367]|uniref:Uncharacterized protein n=1 Tax=Lentithecium fluviatile CBS 122367 TaxID=1168545 RepID=A0A6G1JE13_9PLEO|nr:hypothetical protein K458DRAFT_414218 [Lentithecium fluviatile CBS 122367]
MVANFATGKILSGTENCQRLAMGDINPEKLAKQLQRKFPSGDFQVHMMHNAYRVQSPRELSQDEIDECRYFEPDWPRRRSGKWGSLLRFAKRKLRRDDRDSRP